MSNWSGGVPAAEAVTTGRTRSSQMREVLRAYAEMTFPDLLKKDSAMAVIVPAEIEEGGPTGPPSSV